MTGALHDHLGRGVTTVCRAWLIRRKDGVTFGFTDHDTDLSLDGATYRAGAGLSARALQQTTGLSVDNTEALGALTDAGVTEADIMAGRYDGAEVSSWLVNWEDPAERKMLFRGTIGEIKRAGGAFQAELRGLTEGLNQPQGRVLQRQCDAVLGDGRCGFDLSSPGYSGEVEVSVAEAGRVFRIEGMSGFADRWFERGRLVVLSGPATGLVGVVKNDRIGKDGREVELWQPLGAGILSGDRVRLEAGCDRRADTCRLKFGNFLNFRGFPHIPGEDWLTSYPARTGENTGGSLFR